MNEEEKLYRIKYKDKWLEPVRVNGQCFYNARENKEDVEPMKYYRAMAATALLAEDNDIPKEDLILVEA